MMHLRVNDQNLLIIYTIDYNVKMVFKSLEQVLPLIEPPIVVGISGGLDSMVLLHAMQTKGYTPIAAHFNHKLRDEADQEAQLIQTYCLEVGLPFRSGSGNVRQFAGEGGYSIEEAARILRYQFLFEVAIIEMAGAVAVAHHADDQVETILMNLLRGAGTKGLSGMQVVSIPNPWHDTIPLVRPLLEVSKSELVAYQLENQLPVIEDLSNKDEIYFRNKIRHTLVPLLEKLTPGFHQRLLQTAQILSAEDQALEYFCDIAWKNCRHSQGASYIQLSRNGLLDYPVAVQRRLIRKALRTLRPDYLELSFLQVEAALDFVRNPTRKSTNWVAKVNLSQSPKMVVLSTWETDVVKNQFPQLLGHDHYQIPDQGEISLGNDWFLIISPVEYSPDQFDRTEIPGEDFLVWMDRSAITGKAVLRTRKDGDMIKPLGMGGSSMKVSDMMINEKIPASYREDWPLISRNDMVLWVPGGRLSQEASITRESDSLLELKFIRRK
jgi:tRNA(Ile)-lysidine synthase